MEKQVIEYFGLLSEVFGAIAAYIEVFSFFCTCHVARGAVFLVERVNIDQNRTLAVMIRTLSVIISSYCVVSGVAFAQTVEADVGTLIETSCIKCHGSETETPLNLETLDYDLANPATFRRWVRIFDRVRGREMPPRSEPRPQRAMLEKALGSLKSALLEANLAARQNQRVSLRRLSRLEYEYTLQDLLGISAPLGKWVPGDVESADFDTIADGQQMSAVHVRKYLENADRALDSAIILGKRQFNGPHVFDYPNAPYVEKWFVDDGFAGGLLKKLPDAIGMFVNFQDGLRTDRIPTWERDGGGFRLEYPGLYRVRAEFYAYQAYSPVTVALQQTNDKKSSSRMIGAFDLQAGETRVVDFVTFLEPDDYVYPTPYDLGQPKEGPNFGESEGRALTYGGEGVAIKWLSFEGPLVDTWPPASTRELLIGLEIVERVAPQYSEEELGGFEIKLTKEPIEHVTDIVKRILPLAFRRPAQEGEVEFFAGLAEPFVAEGYDFLEAARVPLRAILSAPEFLYHIGEPGPLDDFALATRLSYFLWKSMPDTELLYLALFGMLSEPEVLTHQVERMLNDEKSMRFVKDFLAQWLRLSDVDASNPNKEIYREYDPVLGRAMPLETEYFLAELIKENLSAQNLIDSDFTFVNRRLAKHYGLPEVWGQQMQKVKLPEDSPRGGLLTQASILRLTADGNSTSPVIRGNFIVSNILGEPPSPPPPNVVVEEPDTRGSTTIRQQLDKHRNLESCASCHNHIDPPGFALESFDPIGGFRTKYRRSGKKENWLDVDASGITEDGEPFAGIQDYKKLLLKQEDKIVRHFVSQLVSYATGGEIQFADRDELSQILDQTKNDGYPVRSIIHAIVQSNLFRSK